MRGCVPCASVEHHGPGAFLPLRAATALLAALLVASPGCLQALLGTENEPAPPFHLVTLGGRNVTLSDFAGKVLVLDFMATTCAPCEGVADDLSRLRRDEGVEVLSVSIADDPFEEAALRARNVEANRTWDHAIDRDRAFARYGGLVIPYVVFVDASGIIRGRDSGDIEYRELQSLARTTRASA